MDDQGNLYVILNRQMIFKLDWNSKLIWKLEGQFNHDLDIQPDGSIYTLENRERSVDFHGQKIHITDDEVVQVSASGTRSLQWSIFDVFKNYLPEEKFKGILAYEKENTAKPNKPKLRADFYIFDVLHTNGVQLLKEAVPDLGQKGDVLLSMTKINRIAILDPQSKKIRWEYGPGELDVLHQVTILKNGHLLVFDNGMSRGHSRVLEIDPRTKLVTWSYDPIGKDSFFAFNRGGAMRLLNGNTLVVSSTDGRALEVTQDGKIVWEYYRPLVKQPPNPNPKAPWIPRDALYRIRRIEPELVERLLKDD